MRTAFRPSCRALLRDTFPEAMLDLVRGFIFLSTWTAGGVLVWTPIGRARWQVDCATASLIGCATACTIIQPYKLSRADTGIPHMHHVCVIRNNC